MADVHALAAAYALDALDPEERRAFEAHYPGCAACADEVREFRETASRLAASRPAAPLPASLRDRVLSEVDRTPQLPPGAGARRGAAGGPGLRRPAIALAAAVLLVVAATVGVLALRGDDGGTGSELAAVMATPDAVTVRLDGSRPGVLRVVYSRTADRAVLVGSGLGAPGGDRTYQLWSIAGGAPSSAGTFEPDADGRVDARVTAPGADPEAWGVTVEPAGGSRSPTTPIVFQGGA